MSGHCDECNACCRVYAIPRLEKKAGDWCKHCDVGGKGCTIYDERPQLCVDFECMWLQTQRHSDPKHRFPAELRPDKSKVVVGPTTDPRILALTVMPGSPLAWRKPLVADLIRQMIRKGLKVAVMLPGGAKSVLIDWQGEREREMSEPDSSGMQWAKEEKV